MEHYAPVITSPKPSPQKNLTGTPRIVKDLAATIHSSIQEWNNIHIHGVNVLKSIIAVKVDESYPEELQELCDILEKDVNQLDQVVVNLKLSLKQMKSAVSLHRGPKKLFTTWPTEKIVEVTQLIYDSYASEAEVKRKVLENIADDHRESSKMLHMTAWVYQPMLPDDLQMHLESLLVETSHR